MLYCFRRLHKSNPGPVISIQENPVDENRVLISFQTGIIVLWDLKNQSPEQRFISENVRIVSISSFVTGALHLVTQLCQSLVVFETYLLVALPKLLLVID